MRIFINELDGVKTESPWQAHHYRDAIEMLEATITTRRLQEAVLSTEGQAWLDNVVKEIKQLREEMLVAG